MCTPSCIGTVANCAVCSSAIVCTACSSGYQLSTVNGTATCAKLCSITGCSVCFDATSCETCATGYAITSTRSCKLTCSVDNCDICADATTCTTCLTGYTKSNNTCLRDCLEGQVFFNGGCQSCTTNVANSFTCQVDVTNTIVALECEYGYYTSSGQCSSCAGNAGVGAGAI